MHYTKDLIVQRKLDALDSLIYEQVIELPVWQTRKGMYSDYGVYTDVEQDYTNISVGERWVCIDHMSRWFKHTVTLPSAYAGKKVALLLDFGGEGLVRINGQIVSAITSFVIPNEVTRTRVLVAECAKGGEVLEVEIEAGLNYMEFAPLRDQGHTQIEYTITTAKLAVINPDAQGYYFDVSTAYRAIRALRNPIRKLTDSSLLLPDSVTHMVESFSKDPYVCDKLEEAVAVSLSKLDFDFGNDALLATLPDAKQALAQKLAAIPGNAHAMITFVGQGHIDTAWRWTIRESVRKTAKTMANTISLMDQYPEYVFAFSQPQLFKFAKDHYPDLYEKMKEKVKNGQLEPVGNSWVEMDVNIPSGESLVRQILYGKQFFQKEFGVVSNVFWMPDVFGYSWALPQIIKRSGMKYFYTSKLCNNDTNRFPHTLFQWQGTDGTRIPAYVQRLNYNGDYSPQTVDTIYSRFDQKNVSEQLMMTYGFGDGGGGPTYQMLETGRRLQQYPGLQNTRFGTSESFFAQTDALQPQLPVWNDEMYFEFHRGTYTSQSNTKKSNRKNELLYRRAELAASIAANLWQAHYPFEKLLSGYELLLTNQFHDILPGSSIHSVYEQAERDYREVASIGTQVEDQARAVWQANIRHEAGDIIVFNNLGWNRSETVSIPYDKKDAAVVDAQTGEGIPCTVADIDAKPTLTFAAADVPAMGYRVFRLTQAQPGTPQVGLIHDTGHMANDFFDIRLDDQGNIVSIVDKAAGREVLQKCEVPSCLRIFEDKPSCESAWNIDLEYKNKQWLLNKAQSVEIVENTPLKGVLRVVRCFNLSTIRTDITIFKSSRRIDFVTHADWQETEKMLKAEFQVDVLSSKAAYEIQFGAIERPTHWNTSYDKARFEVCGHKWADLSESNYGVALLNDCRYGYDIKDSRMRITLLRSAIDPDPVADKGVHTFTYSLLPHRLDWRQAGVVNQGYALNEPLQPVLCSQGVTQGMGQSASFLHCDADNVVVDTVKAAEDGRGIIVRVYEATGGKTNTTLTTALNVTQAIECNLMEEDEQPLPLQNQALCFNIKPFEVKTFRLL